MALKTSLRDVFDIPAGDYSHHKMRVENIIKKAKGDIEKEKSLARSMAKKIVYVDKAYGRYLVAEELQNPHLGKIFMSRFKELTYTVHDWRKEKIAAFLKEVAESEIETESSEDTNIVSDEVEENKN
jgi:hypothetical protein